MNYFSDQIQALSTPVREDAAVVASAFRTSFSLRFTLTFHNNFVTFVRLRLLYGTRDLCVFTRAALRRFSLSNRSDQAAFSSMIYILLYRRIGATLAPR